MVFSRDGRTLAVGSGDGKVWLWNLTDPARPVPLGQPLTGPMSSVTSVAFSRDGRTLAVGTYNYDTVWLWNLTDPAHPVRLLSLSLNDPEHGVNSVEFSPDGRTLAAGSGGGKLRLWNLTDPARPVPLGQPLTGPSSVSAVAFSPDGRTLAAGSKFDQDVWLWNLTDLARPAPLGQPLTGPTGGVSSVAFTPDGRTLVAGSGDDTVWLWDLDVDDAIQRICTMTSDTLTPARWDQYVSQQLPYAPSCAHPGRYGLMAP